MRKRIKGMKFKFPTLVVLIIIFISPTLIYGEDAPTFDLDSLAYMSEKIFIGKIITPPGKTIEHHIATVSVDIPIWPQNFHVSEIPVSIYGYGAMCNFKHQELPEGWWQAQNFAFFVCTPSYNTASQTFFNLVPSGLLLNIENAWIHPIQLCNPGGYCLIATRSSGFPETECDLKTYIPERMEIIQTYKKMMLETNEKEKKYNLFQIFFERLSGEPRPYQDYILDDVCRRISKLDRASRFEGIFLLKAFSIYFAQFFAPISDCLDYEWRYVIIGSKFQEIEDKEWLLSGVMDEKKSLLERVCFAISLKAAGCRMYNWNDENSTSGENGWLMTRLAKICQKENTPDILQLQILKTLEYYFRGSDIISERYKKDVKACSAILREMKRTAKKKNVQNGFQKVFSGRINE